MRSLILLTCVTTIISAAIVTISTDLYNNVANEKYWNGVDNIKLMIKEYDICAIANTIESLLSAEPEHVINFACALWITGENHIVKTFFPKEFELLFNGDKVRIVNQKYNLPLKLGLDVDDDGDRALWGNAINVHDERLEWIFYLSWCNDRVVFKIKNLEREMYLKLNYKVDNIGDRAVWGNNLKISQNRLTWSLVPVWKNKTMHFHIINKEFGLGLKLAVATDNLNDRRAYGHAGTLAKDPERFMWRIIPA